MAGTAGALLLLALASAAGAQTPAAYRRAPGDTLRYHVLRESRSDSKGPQGGTSTTDRRDVTLALAFVSGDTALAWFEALTVTGRTQGRESATPTDAAVKRTFLVRFGHRGNLRPLDAAPLPGERGLEYRGMLAGLFPQLPEQPLATGVEWADTTGGVQERPDGSKSESRYIVRYKVVGDTALPGGRALVIALKGAGTSRVTGTGSDGAATETRTRTSETGRILFSPEQGRMLACERTLESTGRNSLRAGREERSFGRAAANPVGGRLNTGEAQERATELRTDTRTVIELVTDAAKAAPRSP